MGSGVVHTGTFAFMHSMRIPKKSSVHMHSFHLTCLFKRDRWARCSTYAGTVSGAVTSATKYTKSSEEDSAAAPQQCCHGRWGYRYFFRKYSYRGDYTDSVDPPERFVCKSIHLGTRYRLWGQFLSASCK